MKTILWATLTVNGNYAQSGAENPPKPEALDDFAAHAKTTGISSSDGKRSSVSQQAAEAFLANLI